MSKITKRKHVVREILDEYVLPTGKQEIVKLLGGRGNNLHEVVDSSGLTYLVSMPTKFRKNVWIKRGDYVIVEPIEEGDKVKAEIVHILFQDHIRHIKQEGLWPDAFQCSQPSGDGYIEEDLLPPSDSEEEDDLGLKVVNANRPQDMCDPLLEDSDDEEDDSEEEEAEEEEQTVEKTDEDCAVDADGDKDAKTR